MLDGFYALHGWDAGRGWLTRQRLAELGMPDVYEPMVESAALHTTLFTECAALD